MKNSLQINSFNQVSFKFRASCTNCRMLTVPKRMCTLKFEVPCSDGKLRVS